MPAKVRVQQKKRQTCQEFYHNFCRLQRPGALTFFIETRSFIRQTSIERNPGITSFNDFMEPEVHVEGDNAKSGLIHLSSLKGMGQLKSSTVTTSPILSDLIFRFHFKNGY